MITVACFFWRDDARRRNVQLTREDVRVWDSMVGRNLTVPHRRVCVTHRPDLIDFMPTIPLDMEKHVPGTCFVKLQAHKVGGVAKAGDRVLLMDIDCVVTGNIDHIAMSPEPAKFWLNPNFHVGGRRGFVQGSLQLFSVGATEFLHREFDPRTVPAWVNRRFGGAEQAWISERLNDEYPDAGWTWSVSHFTEQDGIYGAGRLFDGKMGNGVTSELPSNARIVFTPGDRSPSQPEFMQAHPWARDHWR